MEIKVNELDHQKYNAMVSYMGTAGLTFGGSGFVGNILEVREIGSVNGSPPVYKEVIIGVNEFVLSKWTEGESPDKERDKVYTAIQGLVKILLK